MLAPRGGRSIAADVPLRRKDASIVRADISGAPIVINHIKLDRAKTISIRLASRNDALGLAGKNDGGGIGVLDPDHQGMGLRIMRYRTDLIGAHLGIDRQKSNFTCVTCTLPRPKAPRAKETPHGKKSSGKSIRDREEKSSRRR